MSKKQKPVFHLVLNSFENDSRVQRACECCASLGHPTKLIGLSAPHLPNREQKDGYEVIRLPLITRNWGNSGTIKALKFIEYIFRVFLMVLWHRPKLIHAHDFEPLVTAGIIHSATKTPYIYDSHEIWSEVLKIHFAGKKLEKVLALERWGASKAQAVITVSEPIAKVLKERLPIEGKPVFVVRNLPQQKKSNGTDSRSQSPLRQAIAKSPEDKILLYQGGIARGRGLYVLLEAFKKVQRPNLKLVFLGDGHIKQDLQKESGELLNNSIFFLPAVPSTELHKWTSGADIGIHPMEDTNLNHRLALPNKLFEYILAGLPVITSDLEGMSSIVKSYRVGQTFSTDNSIDLAETISAMVMDGGELSKYEENSLEAAKELHWEKEQQQLKDCYLDTFT